MIVPMLAVRPPHHRRPIGQPVLEDWDRLVRHRTDLSTLLMATGYAPHPTRSGWAWVPADGSDGALAALVRDAAVDAVAARVVLQRILPGLVAIARRRSHGHVGRAYEAFDELLGAGWIVIRAYPIDRRPHLVAGNLLRDIEYQAFTRSARRVMVRREIPGPIAEHSAPTVTSAFDEVVEVLCDGRDAGIDLDDIRFAGALASGRSTAALAQERKVTHRTERYRRARVASALRVATLGWGGGDDNC